MPHMETYSLKNVNGDYHSTSHCGMSPMSLSGCSMTMSLSDSLNLTSLSHCDSSTTNCSMMMKNLNDS